MVHSQVPAISRADGAASLASGVPGMVVLGRSGGGSGGGHSGGDDGGSSGSVMTHQVYTHPFGGTSSSSDWSWPWVGAVVLIVLVLWLIRFGITSMRHGGRRSGLVPRRARRPAPGSAVGRSFGMSAAPSGAMPAPQGLGAGFAEVARAGSRQELDQGLAAIRAHDPRFDLDVVRSGVQRVFFVVQQAWMTRDPAIARQVMAEPLWQAHSAQIQAQVAEGTSNRLDGLAVQSIQIVGLGSANGYDSVIARIFASSADYTVDGRGRVVRGHQTIEDWCEDWIFQRKTGSLTRVDGGMLAANCPHCGAALHLDVAGVCAYCGAPAVDGSDWVLTRIDQLPSWEWAMAQAPG